MKTPSNDLFSLIKSLDTQEKVFFKIYSTNRSAGKSSLRYLKLFDVIEELVHSTPEGEPYDESLLIARLKKNEFKYDLKNAKSYLADAILNSLEEYHSDISVNAQVQKLLHQGEILIKKKLIDLAKKTLLKAEKLALEHELYDCLISVCSLNASIISAGKNVKDIQNYLERQALQEERYAECAKNVMKFRNLLSQVRLIQSRYSYSKVTDRKQFDKIKSILSSPLLSSPANALSFSSLKDYYKIHLLCASLLDKWDKTAYKRQNEWVNYLESDKAKHVERAEIYLAGLMDLMVVQYKAGRMDAVEKSYEKIKQFYFSLSSKKRTKVLFERLAGVTSNYMAMYIRRSEPEKSLKIWEQIKDHISVNKLNLNTFLPMCDNISHSYFMLNNYRDALKWTNKILNIREKIALDLQAMARIYSLVLHYELGNYDTLPYMAKSIKRFLMKNNYFAEFERIMIDFFEKKIPGINSREEQIEAFSELQVELEALLKNAAQILPLEHFDYRSWIKSKIENRTFLEVSHSKPAHFVP